MCCSLTVYGEISASPINDDCSAREEGKREGKKNVIELVNY